MRQIEEGHTPQTRLHHDIEDVIECLLKGDLSPLQAASKIVDLAPSRAARTSLHVQTRIRLLLIEAAMEGRHPQLAQRLALQVVREFSISAVAAGPASRQTFPRFDELR